MARFGPGRMFFAAAFAAAALVTSFFLMDRGHVGLLVTGLLVLLVTLPGWNWYRLDAEGVHRRGIAGRKDVPWEAVDAVIGRHGVRFRTGREVVTHVLVDTRNRPLLRLDAWIGDRSRMVRLILTTLDARGEPRPATARIDREPPARQAGGAPRRGRAGRAGGRMSRPRAIVTVVVGALGVAVWIGLVAVVWRVVPPIGAGAARTAATVRSTVAGAEERLGAVDGALGEAAFTLAAFRAEREGEPESVRAARRRLDEELAPVLARIREDLAAVRDVAQGVDRLLETLDLPFLRTARRAGAERADALRERLSVLDPDAGGPGLELAPLRRLLGEARERVAAWRMSLEALAADLSALEARAATVALIVCLAVTLLGLWSLAGQVCLVRAGVRGLRGAAS